MKKALGISLIAVLTALPVMAFADAQSTKQECEAVYGVWHDDAPEGQKCSLVTDADPGATNANAPAAANAPKYSLKAAASTDKNVATAGYVKGAYNATIKAINRTVDKLDDGANGYDVDAKTLKVQGQDVATQRGVVSTIKSAVVSSELTGTSNVSVSTNVPVMDDWISDEPNETGIPISANVDLSNVGITSSITVDQYHETYTAPVVTPTIPTTEEECNELEGYEWDETANEGNGACVVSE